MDVHAVYEWGHGSFVFEKGYEQIESSRKRYKDVHVLFTLSISAQYMCKSFPYSSSNKTVISP
jgi:hypothetical protein